MCGYTVKTHPTTEVNKSEVMEAVDETVTVGIFIFKDMGLTVPLSPLSSLFVFVSFNPPTHLSEHCYRGCWSKNDAKVALNLNAAEMAVQTDAFTANNIYWISTTKKGQIWFVLFTLSWKKKSQIRAKRFGLLQLVAPRLLSLKLSAASVKKPITGSKFKEHV